LFLSWWTRTRAVFCCDQQAERTGSGKVKFAEDDPLVHCRFLVPFEGSDFSGNAPLPSHRRPRGVGGLGDFANDLAVEMGADGFLKVKGTPDGSVASAVDYARASTEHNLLAFRFTLSLDDGAGRAQGRGQRPLPRLIPGMPVLVATRDVSIWSHAPMEVGHAYGFRHWTRQLVDQRRWGNRAAT
jgi:hypothetical protein